MPRRFTLPLLLLLATLTGCGPGKSSGEADDTPDPPQPAVLEPSPTKKTDAERLREAFNIDEADGRTRLQFRNGKIVAVHLDDLPVESIEPLKGLALSELRLSNTNVIDLSPLKGMPLEYLNLQKTKITDLKPLDKMTSLKIVWLNDSKVTDISPLKGVSLESLDLTGTKVTDLSPISGMTTLKRLNLEKAAVTDLTPLKNLTLQRLIFDPAKINKGLDVARSMRSLTAMHTFFPNDPRPQFLRPDQFWMLYDQNRLPRR